MNFGELLAFIIYFSAFAMVVREFVAGKRRRKRGGKTPSPASVIPEVPGPSADNETILESVIKEGNE